MSLSEYDEVSPRFLLPALRKALKRGNVPEKVQDLRASLGFWLCSVYITEDRRPSSERIQDVLKVEKLARYLTEEDVVAGWYMLQFDSDASYHVVEKLETKAPFDGAKVTAVIAELTREMVKTIEDADDDPVLEDNLMHFNDILSQLKALTVEDVLHTWRVCRKFGVPPFMERT